MDNYNNRILDTPIPVAHESELTRADFIRKTYMHVAWAVLGFILMETLFLSSPFFVKIGLAMTQGWTWLLVLGGFMFVTNMATSWASSSTDRRKQYWGLALYVIAEAFIFIPLIYIAIAASGGSLALINQAALITLSLFTGLTAVVFFTKKDFSFLRSAITIGGFIALGLIAAGILFGFNLGLWFSVAMVALAGASILYQTSNILHEYNKEQYVAAALGLFASLMLLFWYILSILLRFTSSD